MSDLTKNKPFVECPCCGKKCYKGEYWGENDIIYIENLKECASCHLDTVYLSAARKQKKERGKVMEIIGVVTELKAETTINGTQARPIVVKEIGCGRVMNILVWINDNTWNIATGDDVVFTPKVYKNKKGQECYSVSLAQILKPKPPEEVKEEEQQAVWTDKDRRMARMNALAHGCRSVQMMLDEKKYAFRDALKEMPETESTSYKPLAESTISGLIMIAADLFLDYIYQDAPYKVAEDVEVDYSDAQA